MKSKITARQVALSVLVALVAMAVANYDKLLPHRWQTYTAPDGSFSIELPSKPTIEAIQVPIKGGGNSTLNEITAQPTSHTSYACTYLDDKNLANLPSDQDLAAARDGSLGKIQGTVLSQKRIEIQGYPALDVQARARGNSLFDSRMILAGTRLYMIYAVATVEQDREPKTVQHVFDSLKILQKQR